MMPTITFIEHNGTRHLVDASVGTSLMQVAMDNLVPGLIADCGGNATCATCHCYVDVEWVTKVPQADDMEIAMIDCAMHTQDNSRLSCQIKITDDLHGLVVRLPVSQL